MNNKHSKTIEWLLAGARLVIKNKGDRAMKMPEYEEQIRSKARYREWRKTNE